MNVDKLGVLGHRERSQKRLVVAEDSAMLRRLLKETLEEAGYERLTFFENGKEAWGYLGEVVEDEPDSIRSHVDLLITDIEMPQMDGHHLTDLIKKDNRLKDLPVIVFSSLITDDLYHKGDKVGADAQVSKPEIVDLVQEIDALV